MPLVLEKATEADMQRIIEIMYLAMSEDPWYRTVFRKIPEPKGRTKSMERWTRDMLMDPSLLVMKVIDTDLNEIIAFSRWHNFKQERPESEWKKDEKREWDEGTNEEAGNAFLSAIIEKRQRLMAGKAHCLLHMLMTHPKHHRRGAGKMLVQQGIEIADEAGLPCYLEGSPAGHRLYLSMGFKDVERLDMDMAKFGGQGTHPHYVMIRPAKVE